MQLEGFGDLD